MLHAYLLSLIDDLEVAAVTNPTDFPILYNSIANQTYESYPNEIQHEQIARKYVNAMRDALQEFDNFSKPLQFYEDLAWGGLQNTSIFNYLFPNGMVRDRIISTSQSEDTNISISVGSQIFLPQSVPCH